MKDLTPPDRSGHTSVIRSSSSVFEQRAAVKQLRHEALVRYRPLLQQGTGPIRVMAQMVTDVEQRCRQHHISEDVIRSELVNRTIGDVDLRRVVECEGEPGGMGDYRLLADEMGIALPGEQFQEYVASGNTYLLLRQYMMEYERLLLQQHIDLRLYDLQGIGNPVLRGWIAERWEQWGLSVGPEQIYLSLGAVNGIDRILRGLHQRYDEQDLSQQALACPTPAFNVPLQQALLYGYRLHMLPTHPQHHFKLTAAQLDEALHQAPDIRLLYLILTNNPTTFAFTVDELKQLHSVLRSYWERGREVLILADLAYVGTGPVEEDHARLNVFKAPDLLQHTIFVNSFAKMLSLTGDSMGWVTVGDPGLARSLAAGWSNSVASPPAEWQLRFMAYVRYIQDNPWLLEKIRNLYRLRRRCFLAELERLDAQWQLFEEICQDDHATIYNWSKMRPGEDAFTLFAKTGLAGVPGSGFGYSDQYIRFSIGMIPVMTAAADGEQVSCPCHVRQCPLKGNLSP